MARYDTIGKTYAQTRRSDPRDRSAPHPKSAQFLKCPTFDLDTSRHFLNYPSSELEESIFEVKLAS